MAKAKTVYVVHAPDAEKSLEKLKAILETLKQERRIDNSILLTSSSIEKESFKTLGAEDLVIVHLTEGIVAHKPLIEDLLLKVKDKNSAVGVVEIIDHNVAYEPSFLAFPSNLKPIQSQENTDGVWGKIETSFREMFPIPVAATRVKESWWEKNKKGALYGIGLLLLACLAYGSWAWFGKGVDPVANFTYTVLDPINGFVDDAADCYIPCKIKALNESTNADYFEWSFQDTIIKNEQRPVHVFVEPGEYKMNLLAKNGSKMNNSHKTLNVKSFPIASFEIENNGCTAPCDIEFKNTSVNASNQTWTFSSGTLPNSSNDTNPGKRAYKTEGKFDVTLSIKDEMGLETDTTQTVTILKDNAPFAAFDTAKIGGGFNPPFTYRFTSTSKNAKDQRWEVFKGAVLIKTDLRKEFTHQFPKGDYTVKLFINGLNNQDDDTFINFRVRDRFSKPGFEVLTPKIKSFDMRVMSKILITNDSLRGN